MRYRDMLSSTRETSSAFPLRLPGFCLPVVPRLKVKGTNIYLLYLPLIIFGAFAAQAADWPQWRGLHRNGISPETSLLEEWPEGGPALLWKAKGLGEGYASLAAADGRVFTQGQHDDQPYVVAFDEQTGQKLWETPNGGRYRHRRGNGPRSTPTVDGERVYALGADGSLTCVEAASGKRVWNSNLLERFNAINIAWGISESPLIDGNRVIVTPGGSGASIVALDKRNGNLIWKSQSDKASYCSAIVADIGGVRQYILMTAEAAVGLRAKSGELLWRYGRVANQHGINVASPIVQDEFVFLSSDYGTGCALLRLSSQAGGIKAEEIYFTRNMRNHYSSSVLVGDHLYGYSSRILTCMNFKTGEVAWRNRSVGKGQLIYADRHLYLLSEDGNVGLVEATPEEYREKSRFLLGDDPQAPLADTSTAGQKELSPTDVAPKRSPSAVGNYPTWTLPAIANGKLFLRDQDTLYCYDIKAR